MKKFIISLILVSFLFAPILASAKIAPDRNELLIQLLTQMINQFEQEVAALSAPATILSSDATLGNLYVNGMPVSNFKPTTLSYNYLLPADTILSPVVVATTNNINATETVNQISGTTGSATILVTAQNSKTSKKYIINFNIASN